MFHLFRLAVVLRRTTPEAVFDKCAEDEYIRSDLPWMIKNFGKLLGELRTRLAAKKASKETGW